jgi:hypothetical protein
MSVPPEIEARCTSGLMSLIHVLEALRDSGEPVDRIVRRESRSWLRAGLQPPFSRAVDELGAGTEHVDAFAASIRIEEQVALGGERRAVVEQQRGTAGQPGDTSQFHIIQPQVVK